MFTAPLKLLILLLIPSLAFASPPSRVASYVANSTISSADVTNNENAIFNYLQLGVDTYVDGSIYNADINAAANIQSDKLNLTSIAQNIVNTGTFSNTGAVSITGTTSITGALSATSGIISTNIGSLSPANGTFTNLTANTTFKVGTTNQGDVLYDNGTSIVRLTPGTSGQVLKTNGASANPSWAGSLSSVLDYGTSASASSSKQGTATIMAFGEQTIAGNGSQAITNLTFTSTSTYKCITGFVGTDTNIGSDTLYTRDTASQMTIYNGSDSSATISWFCIGT